MVVMRTKGKTTTRTTNPNTTERQHILLLPNPAVFRLLRNIILLNNKFKRLRKKKLSFEKYKINYLQKFLAFPPPFIKLI
jgi:hypothetical protein